MIPGFFKEWMDAFGENNLLKISEMQQSVNKMMNIYDVGVPFVPYIKNAMKGMGIIDCDKVTFPLPQAKDEDSKKLMEILAGK